MKEIKNHFIDGDSIFLRKVVVEDVTDTYVCWMNDKNVTQYLEVRFYPQTLESVKSYVQLMQDKSNELFLAMCLKKTGQHIGNIKLGPINWIHRFAEISLFIGEKDCWGKGYASEAIQLMVDYAFKRMNLHKVTAGCYSSNRGSMKAFEKNGFVTEGIFRKQYFSQGEYVDRVCLGICNES